jgi:hypothetical protein
VIANENKKVHLHSDNMTTMYLANVYTPAVTMG